MTLNNTCANSSIIVAVTFDLKSWFPASSRKAHSLHWRLAVTPRPVSMFKIIVVQACTWRWIQENHCKFKASLVYATKPCLKSSRPMISPSPAHHPRKHLIICISFTTATIYHHHQHHHPPHHYHHHHHGGGVHTIACRWSFGNSSVELGIFALFICSKLDTGYQADRTFAL